MSIEPLYEPTGTATYLTVANKTNKDNAYVNYIINTFSIPTKLYNPCIDVLRKLFIRILSLNGKEDNNNAAINTQYLFPHIIIFLDSLKQFNIDLEISNDRFIPHFNNYSLTTKIENDKYLEFILKCKENSEKTPLTESAIDFYKSGKKSFLTTLFYIHAIKFINFIEKLYDIKDRDMITFYENKIKTVKDKSIGDNTDLLRRLELAKMNEEEINALRLALEEAYINIKYNGEIVIDEYMNIIKSYYDDNDSDYTTKLNKLTSIVEKNKSDVFITEQLKSHAAIMTYKLINKLNNMHNSTTIKEGKKIMDDIMKNSSSTISPILTTQFNLYFDIRKIINKIYSTSPVDKTAYYNDLFNNYIKNIFCRIMHLYVKSDIILANGITDSTGVLNTLENIAAYKTTLVITGITDDTPLISSTVLLDNWKNVFELIEECAKTYIPNNTILTDFNTKANMLAALKTDLTANEGSLTTANTAFATNPSVENSRIKSNLSARIDTIKQSIKNYETSGIMGTKATQTVFFNTNKTNIDKVIADLKTELASFQTSLTTAPPAKKPNIEKNIENIKERIFFAQESLRVMTYNNSIMLADTSPTAMFSSPYRKYIKYKEKYINQKKYINK